MALNLKHIPNGAIDFERWDRCISTHSKPQPYGFSWYLNWVAPGWEAIIYGDYEAVMPIFPQKKYNVRFSTRPYGTQALGPFSSILLDAQATEDFVEFAMSKVQYGEFFLSPMVVLPRHWKSEILSNYILRTNGCYEELYGQYNAQTKRNLKKANQAKLEYGNWTNVQDTLRLWKQYTQEKTHITDEQLKRFEKVLEFCAYQKRAEVLSVLDEGNSLIAAQVWLTFEGRSTLLVNASSDHGKSIGAPTLLIDQMIHSKSGMDHVIDFEGSSLPGLARFYSGFGAENEPFYFHVENQLPLWARWLKPKTTR